MAGRFRVERPVAEGGFGEVWSAEHVQLRIRVALKVLRGDTAANQEVVARFAREAFLLAQIRSHHVVRALDYIADSEYGPVLAMEFVDGPSLADVLRSRRLTVEEAIDLGIDLATALRDVHAANVVHRDVKPANIIIQPGRDGSHRAVFVDLGVSRLLPGENQGDDDRLTQITAFDRAVGTLEYMAPEQILCSRSVTAEADIYALGAILYRAVAGHGLFDDLRGVELVERKLKHDPPRLETGRSDRVAAGFEALVARALERKLDERYEIIDELLTDLLLLRDAVRRTADRRESVEPKRPRSAPPPAPKPPSPSESQAERAPRSPWSKLAPWRARASLVALGVALGLAASLAVRLAKPAKPAAAKESAAEAASHLVERRCRIVPEGEDAADPRGVRMSFTVVCDE